jgi:4-hydroxy-3-methylbut-2-en-1-yl diphosphate synthase IspG/GcpE
MRFTSRKPEVKEETKDIQPITYENSEVIPVVADLMHTGFSMIKHPESGYAIVTLKFNPVTLQAKVDKVDKVADNRADAEYYFKIKVGEWFAEQEAKG